MQPKLEKKGLKKEEEEEERNNKNFCAQYRTPQPNLTYNKQYKISEKCKINLV